MKNKKLNTVQILNKAANRYRLLKDAEYGEGCHLYNEIKSDQVKAVVEVLVEEINKILAE